MPTYGGEEDTYPLTSLLIVRGKVGEEANGMLKRKVWRKKLQVYVMNWRHSGIVIAYIGK